MQVHWLSPSRAVLAYILGSIFHSLSGSTLSFSRTWQTTSPHSPTPRYSSVLHVCDIVWYACTTWAPQCPIFSTTQGKKDTWRALHERILGTILVCGGCGGLALFPGSPSDLHFLLFHARICTCTCTYEKFKERESGQYGTPPTRQLPTNQLLTLH